MSNNAGAEKPRTVVGTAALYALKKSNYILPAGETKPNVIFQASPSLT